MKFTYDLKPKRVTIQAIPEKPSEWSGYRSESPYPKITLTEPHLVFMTDIKHIHSDLLALLCIVSFYPFCRDSITFPEPVSQKFADAIKSMGICDMVNDKYIRTSDSLNIVNVSSTLLPYSTKSKEPKLALAYGGGLDSTSTICLFPEAYIIHEKRIACTTVSKNMVNNQNQYKDATESFMKDLERGWTKWKGKTFCIGSNNKELCEPDGWTTWISCTATSILLATDLSLSAILLGSSIGSSNIKNGQVHINSNPNIWFTLFNQVGLPVFSPIAGLTEISLSKIIYKTYPKWLSKITYCIKDKDNGHNCYKCWKCFRRQVIINYIIHSSVITNEDNQTNHIVYSVNWENYNRSPIIDNLKTLAEKGGPSLQWALINSLDNIPNWISLYVLPHKESFMKLDSWIEKHQTATLINSPQEFHSWIKSRISKFIH